MSEEKVLSFEEKVQRSIEATRLTFLVEGVSPEKETFFISSSDFSGHAHHIKGLFEDFLAVLGRDDIKVEVDTRSEEDPRSYRPYAVVVPVGNDSSNHDYPLNRSVMVTRPPDNDGEVDYCLMEDGNTGGDYLPPPWITEEIRPATEEEIRAFITAMEEKGVNLEEIVDVKGY